jgi:hypothetical protein
LCSDGIGEVHDSGDEKHKQDVDVQLRLERPDDVRCEHRTRET